MFENSYKKEFRRILKPPFSLFLLIATKKTFYG
jgi:hypothetical protein